MSPLNLDNLEDPGSGKLRSKSRFAESLLNVKGVLILPMVSSAGERMVIAYGQSFRESMK